jgi:hypothetical protein
MSSGAGGRVAGPLRFGSPVMSPCSTELLLELGDGPKARLLGRVVLAPERCGAVLEEELLPEVEEGERELVLMQRSETGTRSIRWCRRMTTFSVGVSFSRDCRVEEAPFEFYYDSDLAFLHFRLK